jgi:hypothetical protein
MDFIVRTRWNHAIEHATIHILSRMRPFTSMAGRSNSRGFYIYGDIPTEMLTQAVEEAIRRLRAGERQLAIHPNCGTNMLSSAVLAAGGTVLGMSGTRQRGWIEKGPAAVLGALIGVVLGQLVGLRLQAHLTTDANLPDVRIAGIERKQLGKRVYHWVELAYAFPSLPAPSDAAT